MRIRLNPDKEKVEKLRKAIAENDGYCVCIIGQTEDTKCPCKKFRYEQECCCGLYIKSEEEI